MKYGDLTGYRINILGKKTPKVVKYYRSQQETYPLFEPLGSSGDLQIFLFIKAHFPLCNSK